MNEVCIWQQDCDGLWGTSCGHNFEFNTGTPRENGARFCLYCGHQLRQRAYRDPSHRPNVLKPAPRTRGFI